MTRRREVRARKPYRTLKSVDRLRLAAALVRAESSFPRRTVTETAAAFGVSRGTAYRIAHEVLAEQKNP